MSDAWKFFKDATPNSAVCKLCLNESKSIEASTIKRYNNTSHLFRHLNKCHKHDPMYVKYTENLDEAKDKFMQSEINITDNKISKTDFRVHPSDDMINQLIAEFIILDCQAFNVVENEGFKAIIKLGFPKYKLPGREFFKELISKIHEK